ncbi:hypothetical protein [Pseudonocardia sp. KRD291]|uniref:hypothetical protein n=1 Tax=Pseudonocardia sp. KRD291 TaxID=2792007 RepID=UPI001C4A3842|nr:hypothetical protein [Pseudonocardia sp. KRD291]MBW0103526.1 hypothetical protein [Pseudonocardia sp. KRD291]
MTEFPAGSPLPGVAGPGRPEPLTVAQLVARQSAGAASAATVHTPVARETGSHPAVEIVSVGSLLRREGRAPHALDRPMQPRAVRQAEMAPVWPARPASGRRRAAAVAGALVAAGSVLGAAMYNGAASHSSDAQAASDGMFPGLGLPSGSAAPSTLPPTYLPATVALSRPLAATSVLAPGSTDWMRVAFPQNTAAPNSAATGMLGTATTMPAALGTAIPAAGTAVQNTPAAAGPGATPGGSGGSTAPGADDAAGGGTAGGGALPILNNPDRPTEANLLDPLTGGGSSGGNSSGGSGSGGSGAGVSTGPLQDVTETVRPVGAAVGGVVRPVARATAPVGETVGGVLTPVTDATTPLTRTLSTVTKPVTGALEPVTTPVLGALQPVTGPLLEATEPTTGPILESLAPVTGLLDTPAADTKKSTGGKHRAAESGDGAAKPATGLLTGTVDSVTGLVAPKKSTSDSGSGSTEADSGGSKSSSGSGGSVVTDTVSGVTETAGGLVGGLAGGR